MGEVGLTWAVKDSFVSYVSSLSDGRISASDGATARGDTFHFPLVGTDSLDADALSGRLRFGGTLEFAGHWGMLGLKLSNPVVVLGTHTSHLVAEIRGEERPFADLPELTPLRDDSGLVWAGWIPMLTSEGAREFQGTYGTGEQLAPLEARVPLSGG